jgi:hypothetical protein
VPSPEPPISICLGNASVTSSRPSELTARPSRPDDVAIAVYAGFMSSTMSDAQNRLNYLLGAADGVTWLVMADRRIRDLRWAGDDRRTS